MSASNEDKAIVHSPPDLPANFREMRDGFGLDLLYVYREYEQALRLVRERHGGQESEEDDRVLDAMDKLWHELTLQEQETLRAEGGRCWPAPDGLQGGTA